MTLSIRKKSLYALTAMLFTMAGNGIAQESGSIMSTPAPPCGGTDGGRPDRQIAIAVAGAPPIGLAQVGVISTGGMAVALQENTEAVKNLPYQAIAITDVKQTLADGSHITQTSTATVARDSEGRTARVQQLSTIGPWRSGSGSSEGNGPTLTTIFDPVARTHTDFTSDNKVAHVAKMPPLPTDASARRSDGGPILSAGGPVGAFAGGGIGPMTFAVQGHVNTSEAVPDHAAPDVKTESLGAKTIDGIAVTGTKSTTTIPAGAIGNDKDLLITRETWYSADLKLVIQSTQTDPRFGETTYSLTNLQRSEPDPNMFQVPAGYTTDKIPLVIQKR